MAIECTDFLVFAENLGESEIELRNSASRAYYAAYHRCLEDYQANIQANENNGGLHRQLSDSLVNSTNTTDRRIGYKLRQAHSIRIKADYTLNYDFKKENKELATKMAREVIRLADKAFSEQ